MSEGDINLEAIGNTKFASKLVCKKMVNIQVEKTV